MTRVCLRTTIAVWLSKSSKNRKTILQRILAKKSSLHFAKLWSLRSLIPICQSTLWLSSCLRKRQKTTTQQARIRFSTWRKSKIASWRWEWLWNAPVRVLNLTIDIGHSAKSLELHRIWSRRITEEFWIQGDKEKKYSLPFNPLTDRNINLGKVIYRFSSCN